MKILTDQDVYAATLRFLRELGHDVVSAADLGMERAADNELLASYRGEGRCFVTRDRDFGRLAFSEKQGGGIVYLRMTPSTAAAVHAELARVLQQHADDLLRAFVVVEVGRHRYRRLG